MVDNVFSTALTGLRAAIKRTEAASTNIANASNTARLAPKDGDPPTFQPVQVVQSAVPGGGVKAQFQPLDPGSVTAFQPDSPLADANGMVAAPGVNLEQQLLDLMSAEQAFKANLKTVEAAQQMDRDILKLNI
jgi:flagellar basal-body rod protein FlgC